MGEFEDKLNELLGSPESMNQIMNLARSFTKEGSSQKDGSERHQEDESSASASSDLSSLLNGFGNIDPKMLQLLGRVAGEFGGSEANRHTALLTALKPYLKEERQDKIDKAAQLAKLAKVAKVAFKEFGGGEKLV